MSSVRMRRSTWLRERSKRWRLGKLVNSIGNSVNRLPASLHSLLISITTWWDCPTVVNNYACLTHIGTDRNDGGWDNSIKGLKKPERSKTSKTLWEKIEEVIRSRKHLKSFNISWIFHPVAISLISWKPTNLLWKTWKPILVEEEGLEVAAEFLSRRKIFGEWGETWAAWCRVEERRFYWQRGRASGECWTTPRPWRFPLYDAFSLRVGLATFAICTLVFLFERPELS